jgi:hypothetical protein
VDLPRKGWQSSQVGRGRCDWGRTVSSPILAQGYLGGIGSHLRI